MRNRLFLLLAMVCIVTLLPFLGLTDFNTKGEPREAIVAYSMIETGNWTLPVNNGGDIAYKPPLFHWCIACLSAIGGKVTEYTSRLPSALALTVMVLGGFLFYARRKDVTVALLMGLVTLSNFEVHRAGMNCRVDMLLTAFIVLALYRLYRWYEQGLKGFPWLAALLMGGATLTKGPVGILLPCMVTGVFLLLRGVRFSKAFFSMTTVAVAACLLPAVWYIAAYRQGGDDFLSLVMEENFGRFMGKMSYGSHENPAYYNVMTVLSGYAPYTLLVLFSLSPPVCKRLSGTPREWWRKGTEAIQRMDDVRLFSLLSIVLIFVFYCIPKSKRSVYLLPIYPFVAYFLAEYLVYLVRKGSRAIRVYGGLLSGVAVALFAVFVAIRAGVVPDSLFHGRHATENIAFLHALAALPVGHIGRLTAIVLPLVAAGCFLRSLRRKEPGMRTMYAVLFITFSLFISLDGAYQPAVLNTKSDKDIARLVRETAGTERVYSYVATDMLRFYTVNFYLNDQMGLFEKEMPAEGYLLVGKNDFEEFGARHASGYCFDKVYESSRRGCDIRDILQLYRFRRRE